MEATLLLVNPAELPRGLEEQLSAKGAFVETTPLEQLEPAVIAVAPDLVVATSTGDLDRIIALLKHQEPSTPLVVLADWREHRALRARGERVIGAVLSCGTAAPLLAARITEFGERAARGEPLQRTPSVAPAARSAHLPAKAATTTARTDQRARDVAKASTTGARDDHSTHVPTKAPATSNNDAHAARPISSRPPPKARSAHVPTKAPATSNNDAHAARSISSRPPPKAPPQVDDLRPISANPAGGGEAAATSASLPFGEQTLPPLRLGLVDTDLTRAGAVAEELRRHGVTTQLVSPDLDATRWHLLRRLAPHGLVVDEGSLLARTAWLEALREDPFLRHVRLLVLPLTRLFQESSGDVDLRPLAPLLLPLDVEEAALRERLTAGAEIHVRLDQLGVLRLLAVLGERARPTRLTCVEGDLRLSWDLIGGRALSAHLDGGPPSESTPLPPERALEWLVAHPECHVHAAEIREPPPTTDLGASIEELLTRATDRALVSASLSVPHRASSEPHAESGGRARAAQLVLQRLLRSGLARARQGWSGLRSWIAPRWRELSPPRRHAALGVGALLLLAPFVAALARGNDLEAPVTTLQGATPDELPPQEPPASAPSTPGASAASPPSASADDPPAMDPAGERDRELFQVSPDIHMTPCEESTSVAGESRAMASRYLHRARKQLVAGNVEEARLLMCKAALLEPAGPASEGLAQLYLTDRSLKNAQHWAEVALQHDPANRSARELLGDIANQRGDVAEARRHWLTTMQLTGAETAKLEAVSRSHTRGAQRAARSSDLPRAERYFRRAVTLDPQNAAAAAGLAQVLFDLEQREAAQRWARHARELDPASLAQLGADLLALLP